MERRSLGRGLGALLNENIEVTTRKKDNEVQEIDVMLIDRQINQPRKFFDENKLKELADSIRLHGIVQPIVVRKDDGRYLIIAGERRYRAARLAGLKTVPVVIRNIDDKEVMELSLIENIQREDLNAVEQAAAIRLLMTDHGMTQEQVSERIGKSRSAVANILRLLTLPSQILELIRSGAISAGHARCLVVVPDEIKLELAQRIVKEGLSVRQIEDFIASQDKKRPVAKPKKEHASKEIIDVQQKIRDALGTKVKIVGKEDKGKIVIEYYSMEQLQGLYDMFVKE
ncbi:MAG: ParB/RepB/Spo0J family partition protein [Eubacteriales bacterium]